MKAISFFLLCNVSCGVYTMGSSILHKAIRDNDLEHVSDLLKKGEKIEGVNEFGSTALQAAAAHDSLDIAQLLLSHGVDVNEKKQSGVVALHLASSGHMVQLLLDAGALADQEAVESAASDGNGHKINLLLSHVTPAEIDAEKIDVAKFVTQKLLHAKQLLQAQSDHGRWALPRPIKVGAICFGQQRDRMGSLLYGKHVQDLEPLIIKSLATALVKKAISDKLTIVKKVISGKLTISLTNE